jgi:hypothetical protein
VIFTKPYHSRSSDVKRTSTLPLGETSLGLLRQAHGMYGAKKFFVLRPGATLSHLAHYFFLLMRAVSDKRRAFLVQFPVIANEFA